MTQEPLVTSTHCSTRTGTKRIGTAVINFVCVEYVSLFILVVYCSHLSARERDAIRGSRLP